MRQILRKIALTAAALMILAVPVMAEDQFGAPGMEPSRASENKECMVVAMNCGNPMDSTQDRVDRIQNEINRGTGTITPEEMQRLQERLDDANRINNESEQGA